ncbi:MAG: RraA family protein [Bacteroidetes bacterium]|nr:RraA family protein [Bacteroidota bacterium]
MKEILDFFETLYTPLVSDTMDKLGIHGQVVDHAVQSMLFDPQLKVAGIAYPCRVVPTREYVEIGTLLEMVDSIPADSMVLVAADSDIDAALWGGMMSSRSKARGARGAAVNGGVRDVEQIADLNFPVFGTYRCVKDIRTRGYMAEYNCAVNFGGVEVRPGDIAFADANGIVIIPSQHLHSILAVLTEAKLNEDRTISGLSEGKSAQSLYSEYKAF